MADPMLQGQYPSRGLYQALAVAAMCVQEQANMRPVIADVVTALSYLALQRHDHIWYYFSLVGCYDYSSDLHL
jgi:hypothetical protein